MARYHGQDLIETKLTFNGISNVNKIYKEMQEMFNEVGGAYASKTNRSITDIKYSLRKANEVIYNEAFKRAPVIRPEIYAGESDDRKPVHIKDRRYMIERSAHGKKWLKRGIVARRVVTFKDPVSEYVAAVEFGRDSFMQVVKKKPYGITSGETDFFLRKVGAASAQPFLLPAQKAAANRALNVFALTLQKRWLNTLKRTSKKRQRSVDGWSNT
jgi:hypothetical protein